MPQTSIDSYYQNCRVNINTEISRLERKDLDETEVEEWLEFFYAKFKLNPILIADGAPKVIELQGRRTVRIALSVESNDLRALEYSPGRWENANDHWTPGDGGIFLEANPQSPKSIQHSIAAIRKNAVELNRAIGLKNSGLRDFIRQKIEAQMEKVAANKQVIVDLANAIGGELTLSESEHKIRNVVPKLREEIASLRRPQPHPGSVTRMSVENFDTILSVIDRHANSFERTPSTVRDLGEEKIRNLILAGLNGAFNQEAMGEVFSNRGKTDIYFVLPEGAVFIAECKMWYGRKVITEAFKQILSYLTWKDSYGVVILFSRNKSFSKVLEAIAKTVPSLPSLRGQVKRSGERKWDSKHVLPGDDGITVNIHCLVYNIS